jgi:hypothetical protein
MVHSAPGTMASCVYNPGCHSFSDYKQETFQKERNESYPQQSDWIDIADPSALLSRSGLNVSESSAVRCAFGFNFRLAFEAEAFSRLSAQGYFSFEKKEIHLSLRGFVEETVEGEESQKRFIEFQLSCSVLHAESISISKFEKKENIMELVRRLLYDLVDVACDDDKKLAGVILDFKDFRELSAVDGGRLLEKVEALIRMIIVSAHVLNEVKGAKDRDEVVLYPKRIKACGPVAEKRKLSNTDFSMKIRNVVGSPASPSDAFENKKQIDEWSDYSRSLYTENDKISVNKSAV